jgi:hypothetical protein
MTRFVKPSLRAKRSNPEPQEQTGLLRRFAPRDDAFRPEIISLSPVRRGIAACGANWLCLAAAPTFAIMALLTAFPGGGPPDMLCAATQHASPLSGMAAMYWLMSAFHSAPWLELISSALTKK